MSQQGSAGEVLRAFFLLGISSFGGPIAHLGYFRREFVDRRRWVSEEEYANLLALCQFLPGPASSQVGFCLGLQRAGWLGGLAAWCGFTLPSALLMFLAGHWAAALQSHPITRGALHGLQLAAVAVVAQAVWLMARSLCPDLARRITALLATGIALALPGTTGQLLVLIFGTLFGLTFLPAPPALSQAPGPGKIRRTASILIATIFLALLLVAFLAPKTGWLALFAAFYRAGALVFGGGHVVLPLLKDAVVTPGWISPSLFLAGYGAAQALPGPLFTVAAFFGTIASVGPEGALGAAIATIAIFLPGLLLAAACLPYWQAIRHHPRIAAALKGVNAAVVGLLVAALVNLLQLHAILALQDLGLLIAALLLLTLLRTPPIIVVLLCAACGAALG
ncbi:chromate efflux transporter [Acidocella sp.]|jgi:chromate transporter|uniref:chromate efflux transporter n=1 Tax=Acidocella sp. TaxID=50710 RepID=UPI002F40960B